MIHHLFRTQVQGSTQHFFYLFWITSLLNLLLLNAANFIHTGHIFFHFDRWFLEFHNLIFHHALKELFFFVGPLNGNGNFSWIVFLLVDQTQKKRYFIISLLDEQLEFFYFVRTSWIIGLIWSLQWLFFLHDHLAMVDMFIAFFGYRFHIIKAFIDFKTVWEYESSTWILRLHVVVNSPMAIFNLIFV